ncbi:MAG: prepilin-type N-terminal cleavage/methylation domain-containing protein [Sulfurimonas sp.]|jgi:prepilin-type N-terminal cleavage/methylation domain-containing protein
MHKYAFTLIELIFAIVIIGISVMSLPMLTQVTSSAIEKNLVQEAIFASSAEINLATTYIWDENSLIDDDDVNATGDDLSRVLNIDNNCNGSGAFDGTVEIQRRVGHVNRRCLDNNLTVRYANFDYVDSLEAAEHSYSEIFTDSTGASGYKQEYDSLLEVESCDSGNCVDFGLENNNTNLKEITVTIREKDDVTNTAITLLRAYSANIGEVAYENEVLLP